ncbi:hypothetical protein OB959_08525 [Aeromonas bestiarum]|uniref:Uncharacterized protein n=2 Tax=Aeromonadaceae TaxID=84642 RepID=A0AAW7I109_9GAMM|nr:hypothetical protein [Aeromonas bestiarum]MDM5139843.1 hypothetical protein [Aeromonas bestiarum]
MKTSMMVPVVLQMVMMAGPVLANEITDGLAESGCTLDVLHSIPQQEQHQGTLKISGCQAEGTSLPFIAMSVRSAMNDELSIISNGQYYKVSGERFIVSDIVNSDLEFNLKINGNQLFVSDRTTLFELDYM